MGNFLEPGLGFFGRGGLGSRANRVRRKGGILNRLVEVCWSKERDKESTTGWL